MTTMKAARLYGANDIRIMDIPIPKLKDDEVLCRVKRAGVCATDYAIYSGESSFVKKGMVSFPMTPGHEWSGVVEEKGKSVRNYKKGDRIVSDNGVSCGVCAECAKGRCENCPNVRSVGTVNTWDGAYAEYIIIPERHLYRLPDGVNLDNAAFVEPATIALHGVRRANVHAGDTVIVIGPGPIGIIAAKLAKLSGAAKVIILGRSEFKLKTALVFGADITIDANSDFMNKLKNKYGITNIDSVIETSGSPDMFRKSIEVVKTRGTITLVAFYEKILPEFDIDGFIFKGIELNAVIGTSLTFPPVLKLMASGMLNCEKLICRRYPFSKVKEALDDMKRKSSERTKFIIDME